MLVAKQTDFSVDKGESVQGCCFVSGSEKLPIKAESVWDLNSFNNRCITRLLTGFFSGEGDIIKSGVWYTFLGSLWSIINTYLYQSNASTAHRVSI